MNKLLYVDRLNLSDQASKPYSFVESIEENIRR